MIYTSEAIETLIRSYALAFAHDSLQKNQRNVGKRCVILQSSLVRTAFDAAIKEACGFGMDTEVTAALKREIFGEFGTFAKLDSRGEIQWREILAEIFAGFDLRFGYAIGKYRYYVDYFVPELLLCLECNGYDCHRSYDPAAEKEREQIIAEQYGLIRFHHQVKLETLVNAILRIKPGQVIHLYDVESASRN